ncbi:MAG TPA: energy transducer TonB [Candidatus Acidoferrales bacterium]|jgi:TonB family protein|nr:energy transducer TonB [Candidatus Acidoferrales bacterium]
MDHTKYAVLLFACVFLTKLAWGAGQEDVSKSEGLISQSNGLGDIWTEGTPPTSVRAELQLLGAKDTLVQGDYDFEWVSPSQWKEVIRAGSYVRVRVGDSKGYWQKSSLNHQPNIIFDLDELLHMKGVLKIGPKQALTKAKKHEKDGVGESCSAIWLQGSVNRVLCFDEANGALVSIEYPRFNMLSPDISNIEFGAFNFVAGKLVPYETRALRGRKVIASVKVLEVSKISGENSGRFTTPENAEYWSHCDDMRKPELVEKVSPKYSPSARQNHEEGRVSLYAVIEADGSLSNITFLNHATPSLEAATLEAVRHWRYKPAACGQMPVRLETRITTEFRIHD